MPSLSARRVEGPRTGSSLSTSPALHPDPVAQRGGGVVRRGPSGRALEEAPRGGLSSPFCFQLVAAVVFISFGVVAAFCCAIVDGVFAARHIVSFFRSSCFCSQSVT